MCHPDASAGGTPTPQRDERIEVESSGVALPVIVVHPDGQRRGNIVIIHDVYGANDFYRVLAHRLAAAGYTALLPDLFAREGPLEQETREAAMARRSRWSTAQGVDDLRRVIDVAAERWPGKIGTVGFCMGGTLVMLLATREPRLACGVIYYGFPARAVEERGERFDPMAETDRIGCPLLGFWGDQDHGVGMDNVAEYQRRVAEAGKSLEVVIYPGLPHGFLTFDPQGDYATESVDSWERSLAFFREHVG